MTTAFAHLQSIQLIWKREVGTGKHRGKQKKNKGMTMMTLVNPLLVKLLALFAFLKDKAA